MVQCDAIWQDTVAEKVTQGAVGELLNQLKYMACRLNRNASVDRHWGLLGIEGAKPQGVRRRSLDGAIAKKRLEIV
ncbi:hypothetical protein P7L53_12265 [Thermoleptolyngbya sichuanensis XZ-Cy5]|uniref:hypothetical protein n=1 Tax=Thermoleptolyngbya sichuanensis TaxID=2885951 RepID=UPI00240D65C1|nr:hypothetical protein [Thermoleptolyngbya sichuanensis]MDG2617014.1 hypothetical protein [Thermoleptolyngbya sichuanensis XZ-Cy5]